MMESKVILVTNNENKDTEEEKCGSIWKHTTTMGEIPPSFFSIEKVTRYPLSFTYTTAP